VQPVPGRQPDKAAARWWATRMREGVLAPSFIPPPGQRDVRDLTRARTTLVQERSREVNRVPGMLARATSTRAAVAPASMGGSGRALLGALSAGRADPLPMAERANGRLRPQSPGRAQALPGLMRDHDRRRLARPWAPRAFLDAPLAALRAEMAPARAPRTPSDPPPPAADTTLPVGAPGYMADPDAPGDPPLRVACAIPLRETMAGVDQRGAERLVAEWGTERRRLGPASRRSAWPGVAPGQAARAGNQRAGTTRQGHRPWRPGLPHSAHAAARTMGTPRSAWYPRLAPRRGQPRASVAVAPALVVRACHRRSRHDP
jgi:transposase